MGIIAYEISAEDEKRLLEIFPPKYPTIRANHITISGGNKTTHIPPPAFAEVVGYADDGIGIEALVVTIDGELHRKSDGKAYHITHSYDPAKQAPAEFDAERKPYRGFHSNALIAQRGYHAVEKHITLQVTAKYYEGNSLLPGNRLTASELK